MEVGMMQYPPGDSRMIDKIVHQLKSQGIFDQFRKECLADVDTKPAYQNLHQRVEGSVSGFLASQVWRPDLNKNQLRDSLRKYIHESGFLDIGVERIVDQVVNPKILTVFMPQVEDVVYKFLGIEKPKKGKENQNVYVAPLSARKEEKKLPTLTDLLPKELEPISPESDTLKEKDDSDEDGEVGFADGKEEEDSSPPFEPIEEVNSHLGESSGDSPVSGISELTSHESQHSHISFIISNHANNNNSPTKMPPLDLSNNDSQLSKVSSSSRLSVVSLYEQDCRLTHNTEINDDSEQSKTSLPVSGQDTLMSASIEFTDEENEMKYRDVYVTGDNSCEESSIYTNRLKVSTHNSSHSISDGITTGEKTLRPEIDEEESSQDERSETKIDTRFEKVCEDTPEKKLIEECDHKNYVFGYKSDESEDKIMVDKYESEHDVSNNMISNEEFEEKWEEKIDEKSDELTGEKSEERTDEKCDKNVEAQYECKFEEISVKKESEKTERITDDKHEGEVEEKYEMRQDEHLEKKLDEKSERRLEERSESKSEEKSERKLDEKCDRKVYEKSTRRLDEKHEKKTNDKLERKLGEKTERKYDEKSDVRCDEKYERKSVDRYERKSDEKSERKHDEHLEHKLDERTERKSDEMSEKKSDEKLVRKLDEKPLRKTDEKSDKKLVEKSEKKLDINLEKKTDDKSDRKSDTKCEKKVDDKHDKKQDRHKEDRERSREKKDEKKWLSIESKDIKKSDNSGHSSEVDRKRSDKDKHKKERGDSRSKAEKSSKDGKEKTEKDGGKEKVQHEEKTEREIMKEKSKQGVKENKDEKRSDEKEKKVEKDSSKEKCKKEDGDVLRHEKDSKKSKSDEKKERDRKEKPKSEEKVQMKHDDRHKERTKSESRDKSDKDKTARHDDRNSKDGSRSSSKESKDRIKQETKDKGKGTTIKSEEKKSKGKSKYEEKSSKAAGKGSIKKMDKKTVESETHKSSHTDHKSKNSGKKGKENKGKSITDDHRIHRDKHSDDRRSTDRDSNGTAHSRSVGSTTSRTNGNDSQHSQSRCDKSGSSSNSSKSDSGGNSESSTTIESSKNVEENIPSASKSSSPPSSLPFKKRPLSIQSEDEHESVDGESRELSYSKIKKPKIAANIFEVKKIMMLRKSLAKKERKQQRELKRNESPSEKVKEVRSEKKMSKPVVAKRRKLGDVEKSLRKEVDTSLSKKQMPEVESDKEGGSAGLKYFYSELNPSVLSHAESDFLAYVKRLVESDNLSEISTSSDPDSEMSDMDDIIQLPSYYLDDVVAAELGAKILKTGRGTEIVLNLPEDEELSKRSLPSLHSTTDDSFPVANKSSTAVDPFSVIASPGQAVLLTNPRDSNMRHSVGERMDLRPMSVQSSSSDTSAEDMILSDRNVKRILRRQYSSSGASTNSSQSTSEKIDVASNGLDTGRIPDSGSKIQKKSMFSRKKVKKEISFIPEMKPPELAVEKRDLRRSRKPSTRYSDKMFASYLEDEDLSHDAFSEERDNIKLDDESPVVACNVSKNVPGRANSTYPISVGGNKICFAATITQADDDSSDRENMSEPLTGDRYDIIKDNNNIDKGSSEDERGCTDGSMLNQDLILPTLRDLMVESGFRTEDDKSDILPSLVGIGKTVGNSLSMTGNNVHNVTLTVRGAHETSEETETKRPNLGRSRRVGLGRPHPKRSSGQAGDDDTGNRMPPSSNTADFVMPLSPESDVSASSGEARKSVLDSKVSDSCTAPSPSNSDEKACQLSNSRLTDSEIRRSLRSGGIGTPAGRAQRYSSDDLYKPRPLFSQGSRRVRGLVSPSFSQEGVTNCASKCHASDITKTLPPLSKRRR